MHTLKLQTGKAFTGANAKESTLDIYNKGITIAEHDDPTMLHSIALRMGFEYKRVEGFLFGGYYRNLQADLYMAIV